MSPATGSKYGGTLLTLTGTNFSASASDNLVFLSKTSNKNLICPVVSSSSTEITCVTPPITDSSVYSGSLNVIV